MKKGTQLTFKVERTQYPAQGIGCYEGRAYVAEGFFPGEVVEGNFYKYKQNLGHLKRLQLVEPAMDHDTPLCRHFRRCGGCLSQQVPLDTQRTYKKQEVLELFHSAGIELPEDPVIHGTDQKYHYRNKMEFNFGDAYKDGPMSLGMHEKYHGHNIVDTDDCQLIHDDMNRIRTYTISYFRKKKTPFYHWMKREGFLRHLIVRRSQTTGQIMVVLVTSTQLEMDLNEWLDGLKKLPFEGTLHSVIHMENDAISNAVYSDREHLLFGEPTITEHLFELDFHISSLSFFQTNTLGAIELYQRVREKIRGNKQLILDLYCGTGTITQILADKAEQVIGIELIDQAVQAARMSAQHNGLSRVSFFSGDVKDVLDQLEVTPQVVVVDPPRSGLHPKVRDQLLSIGAQEITYVSCNPKTLVKDLVALSEMYQLKTMELVDLFPNTPHVETIVTLMRSEQESL